MRRGEGGHTGRKLIRTILYEQPRGQRKQISDKHVDGRTHAPTRSRTGCGVLKGQLQRRPQGGSEKREARCKGEDYHHDPQDRALNSSVEDQEAVSLEGKTCTRWPRPLLGNRHTRGRQHSLFFSSLSVLCLFLSSLRLKLSSLARTENNAIVVPAKKNTRASGGAGTR